MGLFDWVRCGARLDDRVGPQDVFQTKDLNCCMDTYWIDPAGHLWHLDESDTYDIFEEDEENLRKARENRKWLPPFYPVPNGIHGKVVPHRLTRTILMYPSDWKTKCMYNSDWPEYELTFRDGKLILVQVAQ
jgi:hypothetical protein